MEHIQIGQQVAPSPFQTPNQTPAASPHPNFIPRKVGASLTSAISELSMHDAIAEVPMENQVAEPAGRNNESEEYYEGEDDSVTEELKRLDEDFQKNILRAQKVFDSRMDNLQRSKLEKEMQHKKTLQKHERERLEFEKRVEQEAKEQSLRLEKMQREWEAQRELLAKNPKKRQPILEPSLQQGAGAQPSALRSQSSSPSLENLAQQQPTGSPPATTLKQDFHHQRSASSADIMEGNGGAFT